MQQTFPAYPGQADPGEERVSVDVTPQPGGARRFTLHSSQAQRDGAAPHRVVDEHPEGPRVHSPSALFDALFAMALDDARLNSVEAIRDAAYNDGRPIPCSCFQTGERWPYVWTRDLAYATHLGLAWLDPQRCAQSLLFKTSDWREGMPAPAGLPAGSTQIVQDTGSGGSWPVSTDRVSWAWAAQSVLDHLDGEARTDFAARALAALRGTVEADRLAAFDPKSGLYGGEQSFLDWRVQSYAPWISDHLARMAGSRSLSTNVSHFQALRLLAQLSEAAAEGAEAARYAGWAEALRAAIDRAFWLEDAQQYASLTSDDEQPVALHKFDLLGTALAVISGVAPPQRAAQALSRYPHAPFGAPVLFPQQPGMPVYHNRAIWPFVSAYALRAAAKVGNSAIAGHAFDSLLRAAALNLSNMENLEWLTAKPQFDDGPVINSRRQLWSVAACLSAMAESVFGWQVASDGLHIAPFLTTASRRALGPGSAASLSGLRWRGHRLEIVLALPPMPSATAGPAHYPVERMRLNGQDVQGVVGPQQLRVGDNRIELSFGMPVAGDTRITRVATVPALDRSDPRVFAPDVPRLLAMVRDAAGSAVLHYAPPSYREPLRFNIYRDGRQVAADQEAHTWTDPRTIPGVAHVYAVEAVGVVSGHRSHLSAPLRLEGDAVCQLALDAWFTRDRPGRVGLAVHYDNHAHETQTGVTNAVKILRVLDTHGREAARGVIQMPHIEPCAGQHPRRLSTMLCCTLPAGRYRAELLDFFNMSYLQANASYGGPGGMAGPLNAADISALQVLTLADEP